MSDLGAVLLFGAVIVVVIGIVNVRRNKGWGPISTKILAVTVLATVATALALSQIPFDRLLATYAVIGTLSGYAIGRKDQDDGS